MTIKYRDSATGRFVNLSIVGGGGISADSFITNQEFADYLSLPNTGSGGTSTSNSMSLTDDEFKDLLGI